MNMLKTFEKRVAEAFGNAPHGYTSPFSFRRLAKRAAREMEHETYLVDDVDTAPALYTILVSPDDDGTMRVLYPQLTTEIVEYIKAEADRKGYELVGEPLARFMVDEGLRSGKFAVFAENVDRATLEALREEEQAFLSSASSLGGAAADLARPKNEGAKHQPRRMRQGDQAAHANPHMRTSERREHAREAAPAAPEAASEIPAAVPAAAAAPASDALPGIKAIPTIGPDGAPEAEPVVPFSPLDDSSSMGLSVMPVDYLDDHIPVAQVEAPLSVQKPGPSAVAPGPIAGSGPMAPQGPITNNATCTLTDHQTGRVYTAKAPQALIGRERNQTQIVLRDPNVSRLHAELSYDGHVWRIRDLGSTNGTLVNDMDITQKILHDGDVVTIGLINLEFREG